MELMVDRAEIKLLDIRIKIEMSNLSLLMNSNSNIRGNTPGSAGAPENVSRGGVTISLICNTIVLQIF